MGMRDQFPVILTHIGTPIPQSRLRHSRWGKPHYLTSTNEHRESLVNAFEAGMEQLWPNLCPIDFPVTVTIHVQGCRANSDLDNHAKQILDALQQAGVLKSDDVRTVVQLTVHGRPGGPKKGRYTRVEIDHAFGF